MAIKDLTPERIRTLLRYDPETGEFWRQHPTAKVRANPKIGCTDSNGYIKIGVAGHQLGAHRLAFAIMTGAWPKGEIDHKDGNRRNNQWSNLREVSETVNQQNRRKANTTNHTGLLGVHKCNSTINPYMARIKAPGEKTRYLGSFPTPEAAHAAYLEAKRELHEGCMI
jgi:hypothetical protein